MVTGVADHTHPVKKREVSYTQEYYWYREKNVSTQFNAIKVINEYIILRQNQKPNKAIRTLLRILREINFNFVRYYFKNLVII